MRPSGALFSALAVLLWSARGAAQAEAQKPPPNVLLLVDNSGSMEFKTDGTFPACVPGNSAASEKSRWIDLVEVLTGTVKNYSCWAQSRNTAAFSSEFALGGVAPYDFGYINPYHRALSNECLYGPGTLPPAASPYGWPDGAVDKYLLSGGVVSGTGGCNFQQENDGLLDTYATMVRFGLMTFDARVSAGTGLSGSSANHATGIEGNWSYYLGDYATGHPPNCEPGIRPEQEVGARNAAAPPWEGRMMTFGSPTEANPSARNARIQEVLLSTRPYGATPIAGLLDDARQFLYNDASPDPLDASLAFGPRSDPNWTAANCRKSIIILLTDGEPNLDLRPYCEAAPEPGGTPGVCPYDKPEVIVRALRDANGAPQTHMGVETYVIGFALGKVTPSGGTEISCSELTDEQCADPLNGGSDIQACCTLNKIAAAGGDDAEGAPRKAYFAENRAELKAIFTDILDDVIQLATRTMPVYSSPGGDTSSRGYKFFSAFDPQPDPSSPQLWEGVLERRRYVCSENLVPTLEYDPNDGDDFAANLNSGLGPERRFYTVIGAQSARSMRPFLSTDEDGLGTGTGTQVVAEGPADLPGLIPPAAMGLTAGAAPCTGVTADACRDLIVEHLVGIENDAGETRCPNGDCRLLGGIFHSVPTIVPGRPSELLRDESYEGFAAEMAGLARPSVLYTSTVDGFLHAFKLAPFPNSADAANNSVKTKENNELWAFIPPAVLPQLDAQYPSTQTVLLDGVPVIKDVVATKTTGDDPQVTAYERVASDAQGGGGYWRTLLVQGFGDQSPVGGGYFALDITEPDRDDTNDQQPTFRWQLTTDASGNALFGKGGTPLITTVFLNVGDTGAREIAVAVLPGGDGEEPTAAESTITSSLIMETDPDDYKTERKGRAYPASTEAARSLTIVRLDTGEVIRTFRPTQGSFDTAVFTETDLDAPITGQPKAFPETTGAVADRIYVGDRDGRLWRVDVSSQDSDDWNMQMMYDAFAGGTSASSQPVVLPPVLSVDDVGDVTIAFATGSQNLDSGQNRVISLTERLNEDATDFVAHVNWNHSLDAGDRVTGPMVLFNKGLYYAVSRPPETTGSSCDVGSSKVYGVHYLESEDFADAVAAGEEPDPSTGPAPAPGIQLEESSTEPIIARRAGLVFGLSLEAEPTCTSAEEVVSGNETFGYGEVRMSRQANPGRYFLSYSASGNTTEADSRGVLEVREELPSPRLPVTFQSWAAVYE